MNILLVEDNDLDVEILKRGLKKIGASGSLVRARDGLEALEILKNEVGSGPVPAPFVILLDINMPRMNGHEFLEALRQKEEIADARVFVFTTSDSQKDISLAYRKNTCGYIVKPNGASELNNILLSLRSFWRTCEYPMDVYPA